MGNCLTHLVIQLGLMPNEGKTPHLFVMVGLADISWRGKVSILVGLMGILSLGNATILQQTELYYHAYNAAAN